MGSRPSGKLLFGSTLLPQLLEVILSQPRRKFGWSELARELGNPSPEVLSRALARGVELGLIRRDAKGGSYGIYSADTTSSLYADVKRLLAKLDLRSRGEAGHRPTLAEVAATIARSNSHGLSSDVLAWVHEFVDGFRSSRRAVQENLLAAAPEATGNQVVDAFLGGLAEHLAGEVGLAVPRWADEPGRFLGSWWIESDVPSARPTAVATSPAAFRRRGVFISDKALQRA